MARNESVQISADTWTELTNADAATVALQVKDRAGAVTVQATTGAAPGALDGYIVAAGEAARFTLADDFPGVAGADRLWAYSDGKSSTVFVSHA